MSLRTLRLGRRGPLSRVASDERGSATIEAVLITPLLMLLILAVVQGASYFHARTTAHAIADTAYQEQRLYGATPGQGRAIAEDLLQDVTAIRAGHVDITQSPTTVTVVVRGKAPTIIPGVNFDIDAVVTGPRERWAD